MVTNEPFKVFQHNVRNTLTEETYEGGMVFQDTPLDAGKNRLIVNYDIEEEGQTLTPRDGYVTAEVALDPETPPLPQGYDENILRGDCFVSDTVSEQDGQKYLRSIYRTNVDHEHIDIYGDKIVPINSFMFIQRLSEAVDPVGYDGKFNAIKGDGSEPIPIPQSSLTVRNLHIMNLDAPIDQDLQNEYEWNGQNEYNYGDICYYDGAWYKCLRDGTHGGQGPDSDNAYMEACIGDAHPVGHQEDMEVGGPVPVGCFAWEHAYYYFDSIGRINRVIHGGPYTNLEQTYKLETMEPKQITSSEASQFGFNMLSRSPYEFYDSVSTGVEIMGVMLYRGAVTTFDGDASRKLVTKPRVNTLYTIRANYNGLASKNYDFTFYYKNSTDTEYTLIKKVENVSTTASAANPAYTTFQCPIETAIIKVEVSEHSAEEILDTLLVGILFSQSADENTANKDLQNYFLGDANNMIYWKNRLWLSGLTQAPNILFASDVNDPTYFPYPNNIDVYDEPIIATVPLDENLMIFTESKIIQLTLGENGWTNKVIQQNLNFKVSDKHFIQVVRNMLFFKSGNYFYMIVPRSLTVTKELALAPVSKNVTQFLDHFSENVAEVFEKLYGIESNHDRYKFGYNYVDYEDIHNVAFDDRSKDVFDLIYNTSDRTWRIYIFNSLSYPRVVRQDATNNVQLIIPLRVYNVSQLDVETGVSPSGVGCQIVQKNKNICHDIMFDFSFDRDFEHEDCSVINPETEEEYGLDGRLGYDNTQLANVAWETAIPITYGTWLLREHSVYNHHMLDTGYRDQNTGLNKRYRELQFKFNNSSHKKLKFTTTFGISGEMRIQDYEYHVELGQNGEMYIERTPVENLVIYGNKELNTWELGGDSFPSVDFWKARMRVSGKGYVPRIILTCRTEEKYNLLGYAWVSHQLYAR